jgi:GGDEF domain-containing protein
MKLNRRAEVQESGDRSDIRNAMPSEARTLTRLAQRRFQSFSEAAETVLSALADALPGVVVLGRLEPDEHVCRAIDIRGAGVEGLQRGATLPIINGAPMGASVDPEFLAALGVHDSLAMPLETSDGIIVGILCALDLGPGVYGSEHTALLGIAALLLSHEWESVQRRAELRRLRARLCEGPGTDPDTGLVNRDGFLELLDREWRLAARGTVDSILIGCSVSVAGAQQVDDAVKNVAIKVAAEVLNASARVTDHVGRIGQTTLGAILVGCRLDEAPAFVDRFQSALQRVTEGRQPSIEVFHSMQSLAGMPPPNEALVVAERAAGLPDASKVQPVPEATG